MKRIHLSQLLFKVNSPETKRFEVSLRLIYADNTADAYLQSESLGLMLESESHPENLQWIFLGVSHISDSMLWDEGQEVYSTDFPLNNELDLGDYLSRYKKFVLEYVELTEQIN